MGEPETVFPEGIFSLLDTDLYKLTMQSAVLKYFPTIHVTYAFTNRTPQMKFTRVAFNWLQTQIGRLENIQVTEVEIAYLKRACPYLSPQYLLYLQSFRFKPSEHIHARFIPDSDNGEDEAVGHIEMQTVGLWLETILYETPLLALTSEAYFKFCDPDWTYNGQVERAKEKGLTLMKNGCLVSEFGTRRRRDYKTQEEVLKGLTQAQKEGSAKSYKGKITGTSNVHFAMRFGIPPIGTVAHEWFMGVAAVTDSYSSATEAALSCWIGTFGKGVLGIALTDTFGTPSFLKAFTRPVPRVTSASDGPVNTLPSAISTPGGGASNQSSATEPPIEAQSNGGGSDSVPKHETFADVFNGVRQDSGDPLEFVKTMRDFYTTQGIRSKKTIVFSDSLNIENCIKYKAAAEQASFTPSFGVGTFFTNDFARASNDKRSLPLNIVIKLSSADGKPAVKISDNMGKNTGDSATVAEVKQQLGYTEREWSGGDEKTRWGS